MAVPIECLSLSKAARLEIIQMFVNRLDSILPCDIHQVSHEVKTRIIFYIRKEFSMFDRNSWEAIRFFTEAKNVCIKL